MMNGNLFSSGLLLIVSSFLSFAQTAPPELRSWLLNTTGITGYNGLPANIQRVQYSDNYVYISCSGIPAYPIGPWAMNPNIPANQSYVFKIARNPQEKAGTKTATGLGHIGVLINGVPIFNARDAVSYNNQNIWHQNANVVEAPSMDSALGHPAEQGRYHHHQNPRSLYTADSTQHSPLLGFAFDGFPIYGPYAFANTDGTGGITRMRTSYRLRNITQRTTLADGTVLQASQYGPAVSGMRPLGYYCEDFEYVEGLGDLDTYNGRFASTPEYPNGTFAYYVTIDSNGTSEYPFIVGPQYFGVVVQENMPTGKVTITEPVEDYDPTAPLLASPPSGSTNVSTNPTLSWYPFEGAQSYHLQVSTNSSFVSTVVDQSGITDTSYGLNGLSSSTTYYWRLRVITAGDTGNYSGYWSFITQGTTSVEQFGDAPREFQLSQNYPNPFNPTTAIHFQLPASGYTTLKIYTSLGQEIATLVSANLSPGTYRAIWDATGYPSGVYFYRINAGEYNQTKKLILMK